MREIKFRARAIEPLVSDSQWISGFGVHIPERVDEVQEAWLYTTYGVYEVEPDTVGQYTGLKDKNGVEIYEGDLLKCQLSVEIIDNGCNAIDGETIIAKVVYEDSCFMAEGKTVEYPWVLDGDKTILSWLCKINAYGRYQTIVEVIGNIYDHPHLLEGRKSE